MLEALEEGLKGECENQSVDATLESAENYQNDFYISPNKLIGNVKSFMGNFPFIYKARGIKSSLKEFLVTFIHWELVNKLKEAKVSFDLKTSIVLKVPWLSHWNSGFYITKKTPRKP